MNKRTSRRSFNMAQTKRKVGWPRYMRDKVLARGTVAYFWELPTWARKHEPPCPFDHVALGVDYTAAKTKCDGELNPAFDEWKRVKHLPPEHRDRVATAKPGTFEWLAQEFMASHACRSKSDKTRKGYREGLDAAAEFKLRNDTTGRMFGDLRLTSINADAVDALLAALAEAKGHRTAYKAMQGGRRAWYVMRRRRPDIVPVANPFARTGLRAPTEGAVEPATYSEYQQAVQAALNAERPNLAGSIMVAWEWSLREVDIATRFMRSHYRPRLHPDKVKLDHGKNDAIVWMPLEDHDGTVLYPEVEALIAALPVRGPLMFMADRPDRNGNYRKLTEDRLRKDARALLDEAGLEHLSFASFRKGGETEMGDADLTDTQIMALDGHKSRGVLPVYVVSNQGQRIDAIKKRRTHRTNRGTIVGMGGGPLSECEPVAKPALSENQA